MKKYQIFLASLFIASATALPACGTTNVAEETSEAEQTNSDITAEGEQSQPETEEAEQNQNSNETDYGMIAEMTRDPVPGTMQYEDEMWRESVCANFPDGYIEDSEALQMDKYLSEEDYLNSFKWCKTDSVVDVTGGGSVNNDFIGQDMVNAVVEYAQSHPVGASVSDATEAFENWFEEQPFGIDYSLDGEGQAMGPAVMRRNNVIYITSQHGEYDYSYSVNTADCDVLVYDLNTNRVLSCERQIEHERGTISDGREATLLPAEPES